MKRTSLAALFLAVPLLLSVPGNSAANPREQCTYGYGCGGMCLNLFSRIHQHGPLFNYGPYYGYPPFEPYGPWNAYLQYNPWYYGAGGYGGYGHAHGGHLAALWAKLHHDGCGHCGLSMGWHKHWQHGGWFRGDGCLSCGHGHHADGRFHGFFHHHGCSSCGGGSAVPAATGGCVGGGCKSAAFNPETTDPVTRYAGVGNPVEFAGYYSGLPTFDPALAPAGR